jgi:isoleucyl-tRNA synthetase
LLPVEDSLLLDQWAVQQAFDMQQAVLAAYERYDFPEIVARVQNFCTNELGALYLDITKDRLYTMPTDSRGRRSAQSAMYRILEALVRWLAPILSFTAEEIWQQMPRALAHSPRSRDSRPDAPAPQAEERGESVMFETWYEGLEGLQGSDEQRSFWSDLLKMRRDVAAYLENMRNRKEIGGSLDAEIDLPVSAEMLARYTEVASELRFFFITSECNLMPADQADAVALAKTGMKAAALPDSSSDPASTLVIPTVSAHSKCIRCWHHRPDVGVHAEHPEICGRCVENLPGGPGENRKYF